ncbi:carbohydrate-selective porin B [Gluconacetobacter sacchari DSM 12717]|nr:carbohydrate porin [Gluconacetobacter sacchari]GBQ29205.1 carbohydrate-selective porin B [Gluconacetobacter sacchari DSM 12717]
MRRGNTPSEKNSPFAMSVRAAWRPAAARALCALAVAFVTHAALPARAADPDPLAAWPFQREAQTANTQPIGSLEQTIPGFLQSPYGPPSFGAPYGTTHAFGDWGGVQPWLQNHGVYVALGLYEGISGNVSGGKRQSYTLAGQVGATVDIDWQKLLGAGAWSDDLWLHTLAVNGNGQNLSRLFGDNGNQVQQIYGARGNVVAHLVWAYFEKSWLHHKVDLAAGWIPTGTFFNNSPWVCSFMNVWLCGNVTPTKYLAGGRDWPSGNIGTVLRLMPNPQVYVMGGLFAVSPHSYNGGISGWAWGQDNLGKLATEVEVGWIPEFGPNHLIGHYKVGALYDNSRYDDLYDDGHGQPWIVTGRLPRRQSGQTSVWVLADQMLIRNGEGPMNGLVLTGQYSYADGKTSQMNHHLVAALLDTGALWGRPLDSVGINVQWANFSRSAILSQEAAAAHGLPFRGANFGTPYGIQGHETIYEAFYSVHLMTGVSLQPDFQYVNHVGGTTVFKDAVVLSTVVSALF